MIQDFGIIISLVLIVMLVVKKVNYGLALLIGTAVLGIISGLSVQQFLNVFVGTLTDTTTYNLAFVVSLIPILAYSMRKTGMMDELVKNIKTAFSGKAVLTITPALMGSLPMAGGALLSAPLIDEEAERFKLSSEERSFVNVWFRHWSFFINPLSSTIILLAGLTGLNMYTLILILTLPLALYLFTGYLVSIRRIKDQVMDKTDNQGRNLQSFLINVSPIVITVFLNIFGLNMAASLVLGILSVILIKKVNASKALSMVKDGFDWRLPFAIIGVMCFRHMVESSGSVSSILPYMQATSLPPVIILIILAWIVGVTTAMPTAGIAIIVPMATVMIEHLDPIFVSILYLSMVFSYIVSPMHFCLVLTVEYYKSRLQVVYRKLIPTAIITYLIILIIGLIIIRLL